MDDLTLGKNIRRFAQHSGFAGPHCTRDDEQRFRKPSTAPRSLILDPFMLSRRARVRAAGQTDHYRTILSCQLGSGSGQFCCCFHFPSLRKCPSRSPHPLNRLPPPFPTPTSLTPPIF